jgi:hypothetical protein
MKSVMIRPKVITFLNSVYCMKKIICARQKPGEEKLHIRDEKWLSFHLNPGKLKPEASYGQMSGKPSQGTLPVPILVKPDMGYSVPM